MARIRFTPFCPPQTLKNIDTRKVLNERHIRITKSMLYHKAFQSLSGNAIRIYMSMLLKFHNELQNDMDFEYSKSLGTKHLGLSDNSEKSVKRALRELIKWGFIEPTFISKGGGKNKKIANRYKFSENWKNIV